MRSRFFVHLSSAYGHGAIATALYLSDSMGADAFAVATLEEAIALRKAFHETAPGPPNGLQPNKASVASLFPKGGDDNMTLSTLLTNFTANRRKRSARPPNIRILVLGPPVGFPRCFDDYFHHSIEVMISGPEVAKALYQWVHDPDERKRTQVERSAMESKERALKGPPPAAPRTMPNPVMEQRDSTVSDASTSENSLSSDTAAPRHHPPSATLGNVTGSDLAKELREILKKQQPRMDTTIAATTHPIKAKPPGTFTPQTMDSSGVTHVSSEGDFATTFSNGNKNTLPFAGIEEAARVSRNIQKAAASEVFRDSGNGDDDDAGAGDSLNAAVNTTNANGKPRVPTNRNKKAHPPIGIPRKRLRWHAVVDSGMGRLGFRTDPLTEDEQGKRRDSVEIIKELVDLEVKFDCPIEFFGMITHMADANSTSTYTNAQIIKFKNLLKRVRTAGISVPTISTDNSAALLTTTLNHFDPKELLTQEFADTRGFVRVGGAIYGQRPSFPQLRAVSTLMASVRHVAVLRKGESVGYDRAYVADHSVRIATLTMGFADGYPRELGNKNGQVAIRGHVFPVVGNICMDMMMVELGDAGNKTSPGAQVVVGDTAILWGPGDEEGGDGMVSLKDIAVRLKTTQSALTCGLDKERVMRQYA
jgi:alanine racemase